MSFSGYVQVVGEALLVDDGWLKSSCSIRNSATREIEPYLWSSLPTVLSAPPQDPLFSPIVCCFKIFVKGLVSLVRFGNLQSLVSCQLPEAQKLSVSCQDGMFHLGIESSSTAISAETRKYRSVRQIIQSKMSLSSNPRLCHLRIAYHCIQIPV